MMQDERYAGLSYEDVVQRYAKSVFSACLVRLNHQADAEDCFQNTFFKLYHHSPDFTDENHLKAWLIRVAINESNQCLRRRRRLVSLSDLGDAPLQPSEDQADVTWALVKLEPKYRDVLYLFYVERYKVDEISAILGAKPNTVKSLLKRGRDKLRTIYGGESDA